MSQTIEIYWTTGNINEARKVSRYLVQERLVASAQIIPWVESIFMWNNRLDTVQEVKIVFKTLLDQFEKIRDIILQNSTYEIPEISYIILQGGHQDYFSWVEQSVITPA